LIFSLYIKKEMGYKETVENALSHVDYENISLAQVR
jgi:hypothetical protein